MDKWQELRKPFKHEEIQWRVQRCGEKNGKIWAVLIPYIDARILQKRLDSVLLPHEWSTKYFPIDDKGLICEMEINIDDKREVAVRQDGAGFTNIESLKGAISDAFKRVCSAFGIGREVYDIGEVVITDVKKGYPPKGEKIVKVYDKNKGIMGWCYPPNYQVEVQEVKQEKPDVSDDTLDENPFLEV